MEDASAVMPRNGRQSWRFAETVRIIGYALGGEAGCRLAKRLGIEVSADSVLRRIKQASTPDDKTPEFLGVDDWAWRKGQRYGSILVDLNSRRPIDLLPDRSADTFADWLSTHPGVKIISRDRAEAYADGGKRGAPDAVQVADRFHLLCNLTAAAERVLESRRSELNEAHRPAEHQPEPLPISPVNVERTSPAQLRSRDRRQIRLERFNQVMELFHQGLSQKAISRALHIGRKTVRRFLRAGEFPERATPRGRAPCVNAFLSYLEKRWEEGCHNATQLWKEIKAQGYAGGRSMVAKLVATFRTPKSKSSRKRQQQPVPKAMRKPLSPRQAAMLLGRPPERLNAVDQKLLESLESCCPAAALLRPILREFSAVLKNKDAEALQPWIDRALKSELSAMKHFCDGLVRDRSAVLAAISLNWSNGQVEGQVHRLKLIKRQMYGRASFQLLRSRVLPYTPISPCIALRAP